METKNHFAPDAVTPGAINGSGAFPSKSTTEGLAGDVTIADGSARSLTARQQEILEQRGINVELAVRMGWRSAGRSGSGEAIDIPYYRDGREVNCKTRTIEGEKRFWQVEGGEKCLYNVDGVRDMGDEALIITEGEMDAVIALQCGFIAVSVPDGAPKEAIGDKETVKYEYLRDIPKGLKRIILAVDNDNAGANLLHDLAIRLGRHRCQWVKYPPGCKDLNDVFLAWGSKGVVEVITGAKYLKIDGLYLMSELPPRPNIPACNVGIPALEKHYRLRRGDLSVDTGIPSHGKTTFANNIAFNMAKNHGWHICFASFEQEPQTEHRKALRTLYLGRPAHLPDADKIAEADKWIDEYFSFIVPDDESDEWFDIVWLKERMAAAVTQHNVSMIIIDPWNEIDHVFNNREMTMTQYVGTSIKELRRFARRFLVHVKVIAHPAKLQKDKKDGTYPVPTAYDISDSAHWYNKPDQIIVIHRADEYNTLIRIAKSRYHNALGKPGDVELHFDDYTYQYGDRND
jgi:twinkle protein